MARNQNPPRVSGTVIVVRGLASLRFTAAARCAEETPLLLGLVAAFSASEGIRKDTGVISWVRWPNRVAIDGKTVAEASARVTPGVGAGRLALLSVTVNLLHTNVRGSTSLFDSVGVEVDRDLLLEKILDSLSWMQVGWATGMHEMLLRRIASMTETIGSTVTLKRRRASAEALGIDNLGRLRVRLSNGSEVSLTSGDELLAR